MSRQFATAVHTVASVDRLCELELPQELRGEPIRLEGQVGVRFTDVDFTYADGTPVVSNTNNEAETETAEG